MIKNIVYSTWNYGCKINNCLVFLWKHYRYSFNQKKFNATNVVFHEMISIMTQIIKVQMISRSCQLENNNYRLFLVFMFHVGEYTYPKASNIVIVWLFWLKLINMQKMMDIKIMPRKIYEIILSKYLMTSDMQSDMRIKNENFPMYWLSKSIISYKTDHESNKLHSDMSINSLKKVPCNMFWIHFINYIFSTNVQML